MTYRTSNGEIPSFDHLADIPPAPPMPDLNAALCDRLAAMTECPACGYARNKYESRGRMALAVYACGADIVAIGGIYIAALGCRTRVADALAVVKAEEAARFAEGAAEP